MATLIDTPASRYFRPTATPDLPVRRGARVLTDLGGAMVGRVEGVSFAEGRAWHLVRYSDGFVGYAEQGAGTVVAVDADTHLVADQHNNVGRLCNVRGDAAAGEPVRCWLVCSAVNGGRYLVKHVGTAEVRVVSHRYGVTNLY